MNQPSQANTDTPDTGNKFAPGKPPEAGSDLDKALHAFQSYHQIVGKGRLSQLVYLSRVARREGLPLDANDLLAESGGQIRGASGSAVKKILVDYAITRILSSEGGRTSRGGVGHLKSYVESLNEWHAAGLADTASIEAWWIERVRDYFNSSPFSLRFDPSKNLRTLIRDLLSQAEHRQKEAPGTMYVGAMLQHLVGAKLSLRFPNLAIEHHGFSTADAPGGRSGDFLVNNAAIHVTTAPSEALMRRCIQNLNTGNTLPIIITTFSKAPAAEALADNAGIRERIEVFDIEQFVTANLLELGEFSVHNRQPKVQAFIDAYNSIIDRVETDQSLKIL